MHVFPDILHATDLLSIPKAISIWYRNSMADRRSSTVNIWVSLGKSTRVFLSVPAICRGIFERLLQYIYMHASTDNFFSCFFRWSMHKPTLCTVHKIKQHSVAFPTHCLLDLEKAFFFFSHNIKRNLMISWYALNIKGTNPALFAHPICSLCSSYTFDPKGLVMQGKINDWKCCQH